MNDTEEKALIPPPPDSNIGTCVVEATIMPLKAIINLGEASFGYKRLRPGGVTLLRREY